MELQPTSQKPGNNKLKDKKFYSKCKMNILNTISTVFDCKKNESYDEKWKEITKVETIFNHTKIKFDLKKNKEIGGRIIME